MRAALAALLAAALLVAGASAQGFCEGDGWEALAPEVRPSRSLERTTSSGLAGRRCRACRCVSAGSVRCRRRRRRHRYPSGRPASPSHPSAPAAPQDVAPEVLNVTVTEFNKQFLPSETNPDDGTRPVWVPCDAGVLETEVEAACLKVRACCCCCCCRCRCCCCALHLPARQQLRLAQCPVLCFPPRGATPSSPALPAPPHAPPPAATWGACRRWTARAHRTSCAWR